MSGVALDLDPDERVLFSVSAWPGLTGLARAQRKLVVAALIGLALWAVAFAPIWPAESPREAWLRRAAFTLAGLSLCIGLTSRAIRLRRTRYVITSRRAGIVDPTRTRWTDLAATVGLRHGPVTLHVAWPDLSFDVPTQDEPALRAVLAELGISPTAENALE